MSTYFDNAAMRTSMESEAREVSGFLRLIIDKPMVVGDDEGTSREFAFLAKEFPGVDIAIASFTGSVTYSTNQQDVRRPYGALFAEALSPSARAQFDGSYQEALKGGVPAGKLLLVDGRNKFLHVTPIKNDPRCYHCHGSTQPVLGAMSVLQDVEHAVVEAGNRTLRNVAASVIGGFLLVAVLFFFIRQRVTKRLDGLEATSNSILQGDYNARFTVAGADELGRVSCNLSDMLQSLKKLGLAQSVMQGLCMPCIMCDLDRNISFINVGMLELMGDKRTPEEVLGTSAERFIYRDNIPAETVFARVFKQSAVCRALEESITSSAGRTLRVIFDANPVHDLEGNLLGVFASVLDLTTIRANEAAIIQQNATIGNTAREASVLTQEMGRATNALAGQIEQTREQASRQQTLSDHTAAELDEITQAMGHVAKNASQVAGHAGETKESAVSGSQQAGLVAQGMEKMVASILNLKTRMEELGQKTEGIGQVMQVIQDIADQTNLLALNAAIEAARAGDAGRGFAVVADEVRKLAEKTMQSTVEVGRTVSEISSSVSGSIKAVDEAADTVSHGSEQVRITGEVLEHILQLAESVATEMHSIAAAVEEQSASTEVVRNSIRSIRDISEEAATATSETESAVRSLVGIADSLECIVVGMTREEQ